MSGDSSFKIGELSLGDPGKVIISGSGVEFHQGNGSSSSDASGAGGHGGDD